MFRLPVFATVSLLALTAALSAAEPTPPSAAPAGASLPSITVTPVVEATLRDAVIATGLFQPADTVFVQPQIEGQAIEEVLADVGDRVAAGQVLARLSDRTLTHQRSQLSASRAAAVASRRTRSPASPSPGRRSPRRPRCATTRTGRWTGPAS